jgi:hypothetical protein
MRSWGGLVQVDLQDLRAHYSRFSDDALIEAYEQGREAYVPQAWEVITREIESRGIAVQDAKSEATEEEPLQIAVALLRAGSTPPAVRASLLKKGMNSADVDTLLAPLFAEWRAAMEQRASKQMKTGAIWAVGGLVVTIAGYAAVAQSGGWYLVAWGAILFGSIRFFEGLYLSQKARRQ